MTQDRTRYTFLKWDEGLAIMLVDRFDAHSMSGSSGMGEADRRSGQAKWWDAGSSDWRDGYRWQLETRDGRTASFSINGAHYDLADGTAFRVDLQGNETRVQQLDRDLSNLRADAAACARFVTADAELSAGGTPDNSHPR